MLSSLWFVRRVLNWCIIGDLQKYAVPRIGGLSIFLPLVLLILRNAKLEKPQKVQVMIHRSTNDFTKANPSQSRYLD